MSVTIVTTELTSETKLRNKLGNSIQAMSEASGYSKDDVFGLILSAVRDEGWETTEDEGRRYELSAQRIRNWMNKRVIPNTVNLSYEPDLSRLLVFSMALSYKVLGAGSEQYFGRIFSDTFIGKIGDIAFKKFAKEKLGQEINLDWDISTAIGTYKSDIVGSKQDISIKSTDTLESIWAEAPKPAKYGVFVKVALPKDFFMKILAHISSLKKLLRFVEERLDEGDGIRDLLKFIEETAYAEEMTIKAYVCGFFETSEHTLKQKGLELPWLGEVHEDKHLIECSKLKYELNDWKSIFLPLITP